MEETDRQEVVLSMEDAGARARSRGSRLTKDKNINSHLTDIFGVCQLNLQALPTVLI